MLKQNHNRNAQSSLLLINMQVDWMLYEVTKQLVLLTKTEEK